MSILRKHWKLFEPNPVLAASLAFELKISKITAQVLINRGIRNSETATKFINPRLDLLASPFDIPQIKTAVERVLKAKDQNEKIAVYGDYDVDGVTATSIVMLGLKKLGLSADYYIPHRYQEGYGLNEKAVKELHDKKIDLLITVDCGVTNTLEIEFANSLGMEVIVTDHHNIPPLLPPAFAIVNPKLIEGDHPSKDLCGAGVAFKFIWALYKAAGVSLDELKNLLDLVALGTISDVVPLLAENRILTIFGLKKMQDLSRLGLKSLVKQAGIRKEIGTREVSFGLAPRLNAAGRIEHAGLSVELLTTRDEEKAKEIARRLSKINVQRQDIGSAMGDAVREIIGKDEESLAQSKLIFASAAGWHPGVIGIVAGRIAEEYYKPTVLVSLNDGICRGSARSIENFNIFELLATCRDLFIDFGGHADAAGFEIHPDDLEELKTRLNQEVEGKLDLENLISQLKIDLELDPWDLNLGLALELETLKPYGQKNSAPVFLKRNLKPLSIRKLGEGNHLKIKFSGGGAIFEMIGFGLGQFAAEFSVSKHYEVVHTLELNHWNGYESLEMKLLDAREMAG